MMKHSFRSPVLFTLATLAILVVNTAPAAAETPLLQDNPCTTLSEPGGPDLLFLRLAGGSSAPQGHIEVEVTLDGQVYLTEELELEGKPEAGQGVELLARNPDEMGILFQAAQEDPDRVRFHITVEGLPAIDVGWSDLVGQSRELLAEGFRPQPASSTVEIAAAPEELRPMAAAVVYCDTCVAQYQICQANNCQAELPPRLCDMCDTQYFACMATCVPRPCPESTEIVYQSYPLTLLYTLGLGCFYDVYYPFDGHEFYEEMWNWKQVKKQITHNADCTTTTTVLEVTYYQDYCYDRMLWDCCAPPDYCDNMWPWIHYRHNSCWH